MQEQKLYTVADVAQLTGMTDRTIRNYLKDGMLHGRKIGVQWRFTEDDIEGLFSETGYGQKLTALDENLVSDFLSEVHATGEQVRSCIILDLAVEDEGHRQEQCQKIEQLLQQEKMQGIQYAYQYFQGKKILRLVFSGDLEGITNIIEGIKEGKHGE